jgi:Tfp pilus assembly protein PilX
MKSHGVRESGAALIVAMLLMLVFTIMLIGFYFITSGEQKVAWSSRDNGVTYYWAVAGLEQMSNLIADYFTHTASPTPTSISNWVTTSSNFQTYPTTISTSGIPLVTASYTLYCAAPPAPGPCSDTTMVMSLCSTVGSTLGSCTGTIGGNGPLAGLEGLIAPFQLIVVADGPSNTEVKLTRTVQEVAVPIFEFGIFSDSDLSFHAGANFSFGGRVHTNGNLFLAEDGSSTLLLDDHVTAAKGIIRSQLANGYAIQSGGSYSYTVDVLNGANGCPPPPPVPVGDACRALALTEGSLTGGPGSSENSNWKTLSVNTYNGYIQDGMTGAKVLNLAIALPGINSQPISMIQRPPVGESTTSALGMARFYNLASVRILLSDTPSDIMNLPGVDTTEQPYPLAEAGSSGTAYAIQRTNNIPATYCPSGGPCSLPVPTPCTPPMATSVGYTINNNYMTTTGTTLLGGYIKIEMNQQSSPGIWKDVTEEILAQGISRDMAAGVLDTMPAPTLSATSGTSTLTVGSYYYLVTAVNPTAWGESAGTEAPKVTTNSSNKRVNISWGAVSGASGYHIYRGSSSGGEGGYINIANGTTTSYTDSGSVGLTAGSPPAPCTNTSIIHLQEAAPGVSLCTVSVGDAPAPASCPAWNSGALGAASTSSNFVPINLYDAREGEVRDTQASTNTTSSLNGIMNVVELDVGNLQQWFAGVIATSGQYAFNGPDALNNSGFILYTSDRRMNCNDAANGHTEVNCSGSETAEFGNEDIINPSSTAGTPNGQLDAGEDMNGNGALDTYGAYAHPIAAGSATISPTGTTPSGTWSSILNSVSSNNPAFVRLTGTQAQDNSVVIFRRALRLVNGALGNMPPLSAANPSTGSSCSGGTAGGFTVVSENPIYVQGDYNASTTNAFNDAFPLCHVPASVMGDAVTLLSNAWQPGAQSGFTSGDANDFANPDNPNCPSQRCATNTYYRMAVMAGKTIPFPAYSGTSALLSWGAADTGTDGGVHNFLRYLEDWGSATLNYDGSLASFYFSRQANGIYKCCNNVYGAPTARNYTFDTDFQNINKLPPGVPRFTDVNALSYYQSILPTQ